MSSALAVRDMLGRRQLHVGDVVPYRGFLIVRLPDHPLIRWDGTDTGHMMRTFVTVPMMPSRVRTGWPGFYSDLASAAKGIAMHLVHVRKYGPPETCPHPH